MVGGSMLTDELLMLWPPFVAQAWGARAICSIDGILAMFHQARLFWCTLWRQGNVKPGQLKTQHRKPMCIATQHLSAVTRTHSHQIVKICYNELIELKSTPLQPSLLHMSWGYHPPKSASFTTKTGPHLITAAEYYRIKHSHFVIVPFVPEAE